MGSKRSGVSGAGVRAAARAGLGGGVLRCDDGGCGWFQRVEAIQGRVAANKSSVDDRTRDGGWGVGCDCLWGLRLFAETFWGGSAAIVVASGDGAIGAAAASPAGSGKRRRIVVQVGYRSGGPERGVYRSDETGRASSGDESAGAVNGRIGDGQGSGGLGAASAQCARGATVCGGQLRGDPGGVNRVGTVWAHERVVYGSGSRPAGLVGRGGRGHGVFG